MIQHEIIEGIEHKQCSLCRRWKTLDSFSKDKSRKDGLYFRCKLCVSPSGRYRGEHSIKHHKFIDNSEYKYCHKCNAWVPIENFWKSSKERDGLQSKCKLHFEYTYKKETNPIKCKHEHIIVDGVESKLCAQCGRILPLEKFQKNKNSWDGYKISCSGCRSTLGYSYKENQKMLYEFVDNVKINEGCYFCNIKSPIILNFHHKKQGEKTFVISYINQSTTLDNIREEMNKCVILCCNCHSSFHRIFGSRKFPDWEDVIAMGWKPPYLEEGV